MRKDHKNSQRFKQVYFMFELKTLYQADQMYWNKYQKFAEDLYW